MSDITTQDVAPEEVKVLIIDSIQRTFRFREDMGDMAGLKQSIVEHGLISPIAVKHRTQVVKDGKEYTLLAGGRRLTACKDLKHTTIACNIYPASLSPLDQRLIELCENTDRKGMEYEEECALTADIDKRMKEKHGVKKSGAGGTGTGHSLAQTAQMLGKSPTLVSDEILLAKAIEVMPELAKMKNKSEAMKMLKKIGKEFKHDEIVQKIESERANTTEDQVRRGLMDSYIVGDFFERSPEIQSGSMDLIEVDTPFAIGLNEKKKAGKEITMNYNEWEREEFKNKCELVLSECYRILKPSGWLLWWFAPEPWFESIFDWISKTGFSTRRMPAIWRKVESPGQTMQPNIHLGNSYEMFYYARKGDAQLNMPGRGNAYDFKPIAPADKIHPTEKPIEMYMNIYYTFVDYGSHILIPFLGSGNGILATSNMDMKAFGFDLTKEYKNEYVLRVNANLPPDYKSYRKE